MQLLSLPLLPTGTGLSSPFLVSSKRLWEPNSQPCNHAAPTFRPLTPQCSPKSPTRPLGSLTAVFRLQIGTTLPNLYHSLSSSLLLLFYYYYSLLLSLLPFSTALHTLVNIRSLAYLDCFGGAGAHEPFPLPHCISEALARYGTSRVSNKYLLNIWRQDKS